MTIKPTRFDTVTYLVTVYWLSNSVVVVVIAKRFATRIRNLRLPHPLKNYF